MVPDSKSYSLFNKFIETYSPSGFQGINPLTPLVLELEEMMEMNNQFFYIGDVIKLDIIYTSKRSTKMMGIEPDELNLYHFFEATHPDDLKRLSFGRAKLIKVAQELFIAGKGQALLSTNMRIRNPNGGFSSFLLQNYLFFTTVPYKTVFILKIHTNIDWFKQIKFGYHYYTGDNFSYFRYPDEALLMSGNVFTKREFEIIRLVELCLSSEQIAKKLFLSPNTINTHRRNILEKTGKAHISDLIYDLKERGVL